MEEEQKNITDASHVSLLLHSEGWQFIKAKFDQRILDLQNINNIDTGNPDSVITELKARKIASDLLFDFLKKDVYGLVEQQAAAQRKPIENAGSDYIVRNPE